MSTDDALSAVKGLQDVALLLLLDAREMRRIGSTQLAFKLEVYAQCIERNSDVLFEELAIIEVEREQSKKKEG